MVFPPHGPGFDGPGFADLPQGRCSADGSDSDEKLILQAMLFAMPAENRGGEIAGLSGSATGG
jgi:hypothetical protein